MGKYDIESIVPLDNILDCIKQITKLEDLNVIKYRILLVIKEIGELSLLEGKKKELTLYSTEWRSLYQKILEPLVVIVKLDPYLSKFSEVQEADLTDSEIKKVIFRCVKNYKDRYEKQFYFYLNKSILNDCKKKIQKEEGKAVVVKYKEEIINSLSYKDDSYDTFSSDNPYTNNSKDQFNDKGNKVEEELLSLVHENKDEMSEVRIVDLVFTSIQEKYDSSKAGQKLKRAVYTYFVLDYLYVLQEWDFSEFCDKYSFIHKEAVEHFREEYFRIKEKERKKENWIKQKDFASFTNTSYSHFSNQIQILQEYLQEKIKV